MEGEWKNGVEIGGNILQLGITAKMENLHLMKFNSALHLHITKMSWLLIGSAWI